MIYILLAEGFEEVEAIAPADVLRRAGQEVCLVGITGTEVTGSHGITLQTDIQAEQWDFTNSDCVVLPGGMPGTLNLKQNTKVQASLAYCCANKKLIAAICAAPMILGDLGLLNGKKAVCFPGYEDSLDGAEYCDADIVTDDNIITARGAGVALQFGAAILDAVTKSEKGCKILRQMQLPQELHK